MLSGTATPQPLEKARVFCSMLYGNSEDNYRYIQDESGSGHINIRHSTQSDTNRIICFHGCPLYRGATVPVHTQDLSCDVVCFLLHVFLRQLCGFLFLCLDCNKNRKLYAIWFHCISLPTFFYIH